MKASSPFTIDYRPVARYFRIEYMMRGAGGQKSQLIDIWAVLLLMILQPLTLPITYDDSLALIISSPKKPRSRPHQADLISFIGITFRHRYQKIENVMQRERD